MTNVWTDGGRVRKEGGGGEAGGNTGKAFKQSYAIPKPRPRIGEDSVLVNMKHE